jgi:hypothetical protein
MAQTNVQAFSGDVEISSNLAVDTNTLFVDSVGSKVGVGTTNPSAKLQVGGNAETDPQYLWIRGNRVNEAGEICGIHFYNSASSGDRGNSRIINSRDGDNYGSALSFWTNPAGNTPATQKMVIDGDGNVGIGSTDPTDLLFVNGGRIRVQGPTRVLGSPNGASYSDTGQIVITDSVTPSGTSVLGNLKLGFDASTGSFGTGFIQCVNPNVYAGPLSIQPYGGYVGFGTTTPASRMHHKQPADQAAASATLGNYQNGLILERSATTNRWTLAMDTSNSLCFFFDTARKGYFLGFGSDGRVNFTGQHRTFIKDVPFTQAEELEGLIVSADNNKYIKMSGGIEAGSNAITVNESLPIVSISTKVKDKKCFGVISASEDPENRQEVHGNFVSNQDKESGDTRVYINSVGEGAIWVSNIGGSLESGDYITTSNVAGYGQKQESDSLKNYTVAKMTMDCDFEPVTQPVQIIRKEMGDVNYWVKTTYENVTEEEYSNLADENRRIVTETYFSNEDGEITLEEYNALEPDVQTTYTELTRTIYQKNVYQESKIEEEGYELEVRRELVNVLDEHGQIQWEDDPSGATEKAYKIRYLDVNGVETDEANTVYIAAFVGCTYHCG